MNSSKIKVLCIGDSLPMPRDEVKYEETWFAKLKIEFSQFDFISVFKRAETSNALVENGGASNNESYPMGSDLLEYINPSIVIMQLGIVDCSPRLIVPGTFTYLLIKITPGKLKPTLIKFIKRIKPRKKTTVLVTKNKFKTNLINYLKRAEKNKLNQLIYIAIPYPDHQMIDKNPFVAENVNEYNDILLELSKQFPFMKVIFPLDSRAHSFQIYTDGYHPNVEGNELVFEQLKALLSVN